MQIEITNFRKYFKNHYKDFISPKFLKNYMNNEKSLINIEEKDGNLKLIKKKGYFLQKERNIPYFDFNLWCEKKKEMICLSDNRTIMKEIAPDIRTFELEIASFLEKESKLIEEYNYFIKNGCSKDKLCLGVINENELSTYSDRNFNNIYIKKDDFLCEFICIYHNDKFTPVTNNLLEAWGYRTEVDKEKLLNQAKNNQKNMFNYDFEEIYINNLDKAIYVHTSSAYDLAMILSPEGILEDISDELNDSLVVLPISSIDSNSFFVVAKESPLWETDTLKTLLKKSSNQCIYYDQEERVIVVGNEKYNELNHLKKNGLEDVAERYTLSNLQR